MERLKDLGNIFIEKARRCLTWFNYGGQMRRVRDSNPCSSANRKTVFETAAFDHSANSPKCGCESNVFLKKKPAVVSFMFDYGGRKRRERDSNPRTREGQRFSRPPHSTALPSLQIGCKNTLFLN